ncbi:unnamed protein product [marine sediment metagenome]|uniref:Uncharacterized protein n=1 Tax=marine sediment metagenome TaxID=412755 RepID=X1BXH4_9ZZZZ
MYRINNDTQIKTNKIMKKYLNVRVQRNNMQWNDNPLKLSEAHFLSQLAQENHKLVVTCDECTKERYKYLFG